MKAQGSRRKAQGAGRKAQELRSQIPEKLEVRDQSSDVRTWNPAAGGNQRFNELTNQRNRGKGYWLFVIGYWLIVQIIVIPVKATSVIPAKAGIHLLKFEY